MAEPVDLLFEPKESCVWWRHLANTTERLCAATEWIRHDGWRRGPFPNQGPTLGNLVVFDYWIQLFVWHRKGLKRVISFHTQIESGGSRRKVDPALTWVTITFRTYIPSCSPATTWGKH